MNRVSLLLSGVLFIGFLLVSGDRVMQVWSAATVDHSMYALLLEQYVKNGGVDYQGFKKEEDRLDQYLRVLEKTDPQKLSRNEQFAFYINAYNAWTINYHP